MHYSGGTTRHHGVTLALSQAASQCVQGSPISDRIITATFATALTPLTVIQVYAPTNCASPDVKDAFYQQLQQQLDEVPKANLLLLMGDFNAKLGCEAQLWGGAIGRFGLPAPSVGDLQSALRRPKWLLAEMLQLKLQIQSSRCEGIN